MDAGGENGRLARRATALYREARDRIFKRTDRLFAALMLFQWLGGIVAAIVISPQAWDGSQSSIHIHVWAAIILGGIITTVPVALALTMPGSG